MTLGEKFKAWREEKKAERDQRRGRIREWIRTNPKEATLLGVIGISTIGGITKTVISYKLANKQKKKIWDPSMGYHQELKKPLTPMVKDAMNTLIARGYTRHEALDILGLI